MIRVRCPICGQDMHGRSTAEWPQFPFCSPRCKTIDLGRWLGEEYRLASEGNGGPPEDSAEERDTP